MRSSAASSVLGSRRWRDRRQLLHMVRRSKSNRPAIILPWLRRNIDRILNRIHYRQRADVARAPSGARPIAAALFMGCKRNLNRSHHEEENHQPYLVTLRADGGGRGRP